MKKIAILITGFLALFILSDKANATAIVGLVQDGVVYMGGDSAGIAGLSVTERADKKVFHVGEFIIGFAGSFRMGQILEEYLEVPKQKRKQSIKNFMRTTFVDAVRECFKEKGFVSTTGDSQERGGRFLVGYKGRLFYIGYDYQVGESIDEYDTIGSGSDICLGSLHSTVGQDPKVRIKKALEAAEKFNAGVRNPFHYVQIPPELPPSATKKFDAEKQNPSHNPELIPPLGK